jgi:YaiO family outer membrane protein
LLIGLLVASALCGTPALAQDADELHRQGSQARRSGQFEQAVGKLREAARLRPDDADVQLELGLALTPLRKFDEAEQALRRTLALAPDYVDAKLGLARLSFFRGRFESARAGVKAVLASRPDDKDAASLLKQIDRAIAARASEKRSPRPATKRKAASDGSASTANAPPAPRWRVDADGGWSHLSGGRQDWLELNGRLGHEVVAGTIVSGAAEVARRHGIVDSYFEGRIDHKAAPGLAGYAFVGGTPNAHFRPELAVGGGVAARVLQQPGTFAATVVTVEGRYAEYVSGPVRTVSPGIEQYLFDGRVWITAKSINTIDERDRYRHGFLVRGDLMLRDDLRVFAGYADAPETSEGVTVETRSLFGGIVYDIDATTSVRFSAAYEQRPDLFNRGTVTVGTTHKF